MTEERIPHREEILNLTNAAKTATNSLNSIGSDKNDTEVIDSAREYFDIMKGVSKTFFPLIDLGNPNWIAGSVKDRERESLIRLVGDFTDAHLELYEAFSGRLTDHNVSDINYYVRQEALSAIQGGFICLALLASGNYGDVAELERLVRKGETNPANRNRFAKQAMDLLKIELEIRNQPPKVESDRIQKQCERRNRMPQR